eukprot:5887637-Prymnesium_polylepis.1
MTEPIEAAMFIAKTLVPARPAPTAPSRPVPSRAVPCPNPFPQTHSPLSLRMGSNPRSDVLRPHAITAALIAR